MSPYGAAGCNTCHEDGQPGYCAPLRCYCGHPACPAYPSWRDVRADTEEVPLENPQHQA